jgi:Complex I intermediate-associated protein 30 (CIA30)
MAKWDLQRFWQTLVDFNELPLAQPLQQSKTPSTTSNFMNPTVLVIGELGHLVQRVIGQLWQKNYQPRLLVTNSTLAAAREMFPQGVDIVVGHGGDQSATIWSRVAAAIYCPATVSQPELEQLVQAANQYLPQERELFDFTRPQSGLAQQWSAIDDVVMGGVSASGLSLLEDCAVFSGHVSVENSGGFVSIRTRNFDPPLDLGRYEGISLRLRGGGQRYKIFLRPTAQWDGLGYAYSFDTDALTFTNLRIPFRNFVPVMRAKTVPNAPFLDPSQISSLQIMLSKFEYDGGLNPHFRSGDFRLELFSIGAYGCPPCPQLIVVAPRTATVGNIEQPLGGCLKPYTLLEMGIVVDRPGGQSLDFSLQEEPNGSVSSEDLAELCVQLLRIPDACHKHIGVREVGRRGLNLWPALVAKAIRW